MAATNEQTKEFEMLHQIEGCGYEPIEKRGGGTYGVVWGVLDNTKGQVAYKYIEPYKYSEYGLEGLNEVDVSTRMNHPYLGHAYKVVTARDCNIKGLALLLPEGDRGTLHTVATGEIPGLTFINKLSILFKLATALDFLHQNHILHLDIKLDNVVLKGDALHPYLIDFGLAMVVDDIATGFYNSNKFVTITYRAPEILAGGHQYNGAVDIWAFGILMLYTLTGEEYHKIQHVGKDDVLASTLLLHELTKFNDPSTYTRMLRNLPSNYIEPTRDFFLKVLNSNPDQRLTANEIVNHEIFSQVKFDVIGRVIEPSINDPIISNYSADHQTIINTLIHWTNEIYPHERSELLFLAIDLYYRVASMYNSPVQYNERLSLAAACLWSASNILRIHHIALSEYVPIINRKILTIKPVTILTNQNILKSQIDIVDRTEGRLHISELYRSCQTAQELAISLKYVIGYQVKDHDALLYPQTHIPDWIAYMQDPDGVWVMDTAITDSKQMQCNQLIQLAKNIQLYTLDTLQ